MKFDQIIKLVFILYATTDFYCRNFVVPLIINVSELLLYGMYMLGAVGIETGKQVPDLS